jgi:sulfite reductase (NADPH) flavoprotein alpha-component
MSTFFSSSDSNAHECGFSKDNPFFGKIQQRHLLNKPGSTKKTYHVTLDISGSDLVFHEGDALAIFPSNPPSLVEDLIDFLKVDGSLIVTYTKKHLTKSFSLFECLSNHVNITKVSPQLFEVIKQYATCPDCRAHLNLLSDPEQKEAKLEFLHSHDVNSLAKKAQGLNCSAQIFVESLAPLLPRFYSIASSSAIDPNAIDLLVATFSYQVQGELRSGIGSEFLATAASKTTPIPLYIHKNPHFKLPEDIATPIIMIGPGTGLAPFRAFLQKRIFQEPTSKNWLFFGERNQAYDFYYEKELKKLEAQGSLILSLAFSRDQEEKIYVQDLMLSSKKQLWEWISQGAYVYICGDAKHMAKAVSEALLKIFISEGNMSEEAAKTFLSLLRKTKQLQLDVY